MKKTILFTMLALLGMTQAVAQEYEYVPLVREGVKWVYSYQNTGEIYPPDPNLSVGVVNLTLELKGDTVIDGKTYKAMHKYYGDNINTENDTIPIYLREEDKIVYGFVPHDGKTYYDCPICGLYDPSVFSLIEAGKEFILYDFNDPLAFFQSNSNLYKSCEYSYEAYGGIKPFRFADMVNINGHQAKRYVFTLLRNCCVIEGIGFDSMYEGYLLSYGYNSFSCDPIFSLIHVIEDGKVIYQSAPLVGNQQFLPIARQDVKWVNEHVSVHEGDTTCYYYTYEFMPRGNSSSDYSCYYSSRDEMNPCTDSIVSLVQNGVYFDFSSRQNKMLEAVLERGDNLINFLYGYQLYQFDEADISPYCILNYYIDNQKYDLLNRENFVEVDPLVIEGVSCCRYAYVGEQGDTLAYVVEGIGFDSYEMGDLLTPFTRKPDPDADYQEWCGLSHVVKDGKIIYKGMRYRHGAFDGIDEVVADKSLRRPQDDNYYNLMGQPVGKDVPTTPGIYIHQGKKIIVR